MRHSIEAPSDVFRTLRQKKDHFFKPVFFNLGVGNMVVDFQFPVCQRYQYAARAVVAVMFYDFGCGSDDFRIFEHLAEQKIIGCCCYGSLLFDGFPEWLLFLMEKAVYRKKEK